MMNLFFSQSLREILSSLHVLVPGKLHIIKVPFQELFIHVVRDKFTKSCLPMNKTLYRCVAR